MTTVPFRAEVSSNILKKADRLFSNRLSAIFIELIQNSRRAGARLITVTATPEVDDLTLVSFEDDGTGVEDFSALLHLGRSDWNSEVERRDGPAGMGFFSLIHTGVLVQSLGLSAYISPDAFMGLDSVTAEPSSDAPAKGTRLNFRRTEQIHAVISALTSVAQFGSVDVVVNGVLIERRDFLAESLYTKTVDGVRIGVFSGGTTRNQCNFHGSVIDLQNRSTCLSDVTIPTAHHASLPGGLHVKIDVIETTGLHLKLPDRTQVVEDEAFDVILRKARIAMYEYLATLPVHCASYTQYQEAHALGIDLVEATPFLRPYFVFARDTDHDDSFSCGFETTTSIVDISRIALVDHASDVFDLEAFTFVVGYTRLKNVLPLLPVEMSPRYKGYAWYDSLPLYQNFALLIDGEPASTKADEALLTIVNSIELRFELNRTETDIVSFSWDLPFAGYADEDEYFDRACCLFITKGSPWEKHSDPYGDPFSLETAANHLGFSYNDDAASDSYDTQVDNYSDSVKRELTRTLGGELAMARLELAKLTAYSDLTMALNAASIRSVRLLKGAKGWTYQINDAA